MAALFSSLVRSASIAKMNFLESLLPAAGIMPEEYETNSIVRSLRCLPQPAESTPAADDVKQDEFRAERNKDNQPGFTTCGGTKVASHHLKEAMTQNLQHAAAREAADVEETFISSKITEAKRA